MPQVTVIMPVFNAAAHIERAISSVQSQSVSDWEICAVDDGSNDESWAALEAMTREEPRLRSFQHTENLGAGAARNYAIREARGRYIAFLDADDEWLPEKLERQLRFMHETDAAFTCTAYHRFHQGAPRRISHVPYKANRSQLLKNNTVGALTAIYDSKYFGKKFMPDIRRRQDYALWLDLLRETDAVYGLNEPLAIHHRGHSSLSSHKGKAARDQWRFFRDVEGLDIARSIWYFGHYAINATKRNL